VGKNDADDEDNGDDDGNDEPRASAKDRKEAKQQPTSIFLLVVVITVAVEQQQQQQQQQQQKQQRCGEGIQWGSGATSALLPSPGGHSKAQGSPNRPLKKQYSGGHGALVGSKDYWAMLAAEAAEAKAAEEVEPRSDTLEFLFLWRWPDGLWLLANV